jgi:hypothetical protein
MGLLSVLFAALFFSAGARATTLLTIGGKSLFVRGANLAWLDGNYGSDIGLNPIHPSYGINYNSTHMANYMANMKSMGCNVIRIWLFEEEEGLTFNSSGQVSGLNSTFLTNLDNIVSLAGQNGLHCYFTLLNSPTQDGYGDIYTNSTDQNDYINNAVIPLVSRYKGNSSIFAFDINNEIESQIGGSNGNYGSGITWTQAQSYIKAVASAIHGTDSTRLCTCTSGWHSWSNLQAGLFLGLGLDFYDCHVYSDDGGIPTASSLNLDKPVILGEFGQATDSWNDTTDNTSVGDFVYDAINNGWAGCAKWDYEYPGSTDYLGMLEQNSTQSDLIWRPGTWTLEYYYTKSIDGDGGPSGGSGGSGGGNLIANGTYVIESNHSGDDMVIDDPGSSTTEGEDMDQWYINNGTNQQWKLTNLGNNVVELVNVASGQCLEVAGGSKSNSALVDQWPYNGNPWQQWNVISVGSGVYELTNVNSGLALDVDGAGTTEGADIDQYSYGGNAWQQWKFLSP